MVASEDAQAEWELINRAAEDYLLIRAGIPLTDKQHRGQGLAPKFEMKPIATLSADAQGAITERNARNNHKVDQLATRANNDRQDNLGIIAQFFRDHQRAYVKLTCDVHSFLIDMVKAIDSARQELAKRGEGREPGLQDSAAACFQQSQLC